MEYEERFPALQGSLHIQKERTAELETLVGDCVIK